MNATKDFAEMTADEIRNYDGPTFHATIIWSAEDGTRVRSDLTSTTAENLRAKIEACRSGRCRFAKVEFGPVVTASGIVIDTDPATGSPNVDEAKYTRTRPVGL